LLVQVNVISDVGKSTIMVFVGTVDAVKESENKMI
jgi:hypothetical protein